MRNSRLLTILMALMKGENISAPKMAREMGVSVRTIYRDMDALAEAGIPIYAQPGQNGGFRIVEGYKLRDLTMSPRERDFLQSLMKDLSSTSEEAASLHAKLGALQQGQPTNDWLHIDMAEQDETFSLCKNAINERRLLRFAYRKTEGCKERRVEPMTLVFQFGRFYLFGYCLAREDYRLFRLSRMSHVEILEQDFTPRDMRYQNWYKAANPMPPDHVLLLASESEAQRVLDDFPPDTIVHTAEGFLIRLQWWVDPWMIGMILSYGENMQVLHPQWLQKLILTRLERAEINQRSVLKEEETMEANMKFCQSCAMPLSEGDYGTEKDGSKNETYCQYCYKDGAFTSETTMEEMIEGCVPFVSKGNPYADEESARKAMQEIFPQLERWKK